MPFFKWYGIDLEGKKRSGSMIARSALQLDALLLQANIACLESRQTKPFVLMWRVPLVTKVQFFRQLSILLSSGIFLDQALELLIHQIGNRAFKAVVQDILVSVQHGIRLSQAIMDHKLFFDVLTIHMIEVGQESGKLPEALEHLCAYQENIVVFKKQLRSAALLPLITFVFFLVIALVIFIAIVPAFASLFLSTGQALPATTQTMLQISDFLRHPWTLISAILSLIVVLISYCCFERSYLYNKIMYFLYYVPFLGTLSSQAMCAYFFHSLYLLTQTGVHLITGLSVAQESMNNSLMKSVVQSIKNDVQEGITMSNAMLKHKRFFPVPVQALIAVGQESACLPFMFMQASTLYKEQVSRKLMIISTVLQPLLMIIIGLMITFLIFAVYLPIFNLSSVIN